MNDKISKRILLNMAINHATKKQTSDFIENDKFKEKVISLYELYKEIHTEKDLL